METKSTTTESIQMQGKFMAVCAYLTIVGLLIAFINNKKQNNPLVQFHLRQSIGLTIFAFVTSLLQFVPFVGWILASVAGLVVLILWVLGLWTAWNEKQSPLPIVGEKLQAYFSSL